MPEQPTRVISNPLAQPPNTTYGNGDVTRGIYRIRNDESGSCYACVEYDTLATMNVPELRYRERRYKPEFDRLPWKEDYDSNAAAKKS